MISFNRPWKKYQQDFIDLQVTSNDVLVHYKKGKPEKLMEMIRDFNRQYVMSTFPERIPLRSKEPVIPSRVPVTNDEIRTMLEAGWSTRELYDFCDAAAGRLAAVKAHITRRQAA